MVWARFDDDYPNNRKVRRLTDAEYRLDSSAICWISRHGTDGHIPADELDVVSDVKRPVQAANGLISKGRWHAPGHDCKSEWCRPIDDGWLVHDFLAYNPSAAQVQAARDARSKAGSLGGKTSSRRRANLQAVGEANA